MNLRARYNEALKNMLPPGCGCHTYLLAVANYGIIVGLGVEQIFSDIRRSIPQGSRKIPDKETHDAIRKAISDHGSGTYTPRPRPKPIVHDGKAALQKIIDQAKISTEVDLWESSPLRLWDEPINDTILFLRTLYKPDDLIWIGNHDEPGIIGQTLRSAYDWINHFQTGGETFPHIIINPLNGIPTPTKSGDKTTLRGDANVTAFKCCLVEFDNISREDQIRFWSAARLPVVCLIDSGGKSIHAWLDVQKMATVETSEQWQVEIKQHLYDRLLAPLGVDKACSNPARLSRLPGHYRTEKGNYQKILWLSGREGKFII